MSWDEIQELDAVKEYKNGSWNKFVQTLGNAPHVIKHDYLLREMGQMNSMNSSSGGSGGSGDDIAKLLGHMNQDNEYIV